MIDAGRFVRDLPDKLDPRARLVAYAIAAFSERDGSACPSSRQLVKATGMSAETIARAIRRLEEAGVIAVTRRADRLSQYRFPVAAVAELSTTARASAARSSYPQPRGSVDETARPMAAQLRRHVEKNTRADGALWIQGAGWCAPITHHHESSTGT